MGRRGVFFAPSSSLLSYLRSDQAWYGLAGWLVSGGHTPDTLHRSFRCAEKRVPFYFIYFYTFPLLNSLRVAVWAFSPSQGCVTKVQSTKREKGRERGEGAELVELPECAKLAERQERRG